MPIPTLSAEAVRRALDEYDRLGADGFLAKYGYGRAKEYVVERNGRRYDSKAIAGVAHGYAHPSGRPLVPTDFSGGEAQVAKRHRRLGFDVVHVPRTTAVMPPTTALALPLHTKTTRKDVYRLFGIEFSQRNRQLIKGLSPRLPD